MNPDKVRSVLEGTAFKIPCPVPPTVDYTNEGRPAEFTATCEGTLQFNGFYGHGSVDAWYFSTEDVSSLDHKVSARRCSESRINFWVNATS